MTETLHGLVYQTERSFCRPSVDSLALAAFAPAKGRIAELCCGAGLIGLLLCRRDSRCRVTGIDNDPLACAESRDNAAANDLTNRFCVVEGDLRDPLSLPPAGCFDGAVANPPYHAAAGRRSPDPARANAHSDLGCPLESVCAAAARLVRTGGSFSIVYPADRLADLFFALREAGFEPKRIRLVRHTAAHPPSLVLVEARRCGGVGLRFESDLILHDADGQPTEAYRAVCDR